MMNMNTLEIRNRKTGFGQQVAAERIELASKSRDVYDIELVVDSLTARDLGLVVDGKAHNGTDFRINRVLAKSASWYDHTGNRGIERFKIKVHMS